MLRAEPFTVFISPVVWATLPFAFFVPQEVVATPRRRIRGLQDFEFGEAFLSRIIHQLDDLGVCFVVDVPGRPHHLGE